MIGPKGIADFDSATAMLRALARHLHGAPFPLRGAMPPQLAGLMRMGGRLVNSLPRPMREQVYIWSGRFEAISPRRLGRIDMEQVARWIVDLYPKRRYPAVAIGSSNGAATHLWAALGIPWLPQTLLIPVARSGCHPDDPAADAQWALKPARALLAANPQIQLHHMHDPVQDRLMIQRMTYFRVKRLRLGAAYESFLRESLEPGGTIIVSDCKAAWPTTRHGERHFFQFGALGGATADEYLNGSQRVQEYLRRYHSPRRRWIPPEPDGISPEAEWGFAPELGDEIETFAARHQFRVKRFTFEDPENVSPLAADFYLWWNGRRGIREARLIVDSFILMEPHLTVRSGAVPFWMLFNTRPSAVALDNYLGNGKGFAEIYLMLFSHGVESIGLVPIHQWRRILARAPRGDFIGVDEDEYPRDFATFVRYHDDLVARLGARYPIPPGLALSDLESFIEGANGNYRVEWR